MAALRAYADIDFYPPWQATAPCTGRGRDMDPDERAPAEVARARAICHDCPVLERCREWIAGIPLAADPGGVIAALTFHEREELELAKQPPRTCRTCGEPKPWRAFPPAKRGRPGRSWHCRTCHNARDRARHAKRKAPQ
ncbi:hypothetical protein E1295_46995 [Nonomuraea mesophila]|uniref:4Fe-4S Wbl-type domain-containing protein n=1 Tax=Nonomuraea mesophila TaxID=2530382 RepID=A0A4R5E3Q1_9ACTN|nr:WhiB family transcriptional regulator [Nonomuraea mesophila]TDE20851.1 hypothetical protein E1295_46995 [Nonomuraea mesophila]